jgi:hypothetical protein
MLNNVSDSLLKVMAMDFVSVEARKMKADAEPPKPAYLISGSKPYVDPRILQSATEYAVTYSNERFNRRPLPSNDFPEHVLGFTHADPVTREFVRLPSENVPRSVFGVYAGEFVDWHEKGHILAAICNRPQDEAAMDAYARGKVGCAHRPA